MLSGSVISQVIPIALQPVLKRYYSPEVFGVYEIYFRLGTLLFIVYTLRYEVSIFYPKKKKDMKKLVVMTITIAFLFFIISELIALFGSSKVARLIDLDLNYTYVVFLIPLAGFSYALFRIFTNYYISSNLLKSLSVAKVVRRSTEGAVQVIFGFLARPVGLFIGELSGILLTVGYMVKKEGIKLRSLLNFKEGIKGMKQYAEIPKNYLVPDLLNTFTDGVLVFLVLREFTFREAGLLELALKILIVPTALLASNIGPLIIQRITRALNERVSFKKDLTTIFIILFSVGLGFAVAVFLFGKPVFDLLFTSEWDEAFLYVEVLVIYAVVQLVIAPFGQVLVAFKKFRYDAVWKVLKFVGLGSLFFLTFENVYDLLWTYTIVASAIYLIYAVVIVYALYEHKPSIAKH